LANFVFLFFHTARGLCFADQKRFNHLNWSQVISLSRQLSPGQSFIDPIKLLNRALEQTRSLFKLFKPFYPLVSIQRRFNRVLILLLTFLIIRREVFARANKSMLLNFVRKEEICMRRMPSKNALEKGFIFYWRALICHAKCFGDFSLRMICLSERGMRLSVV
jgi:hypothetical protein